MAIDIYKKTPIVTQSNEHILLNALGGKLTSPAILDKTTNDEFGSSIDAALANVLLLFRGFLDARSGEGRQAPPIRGMTTSDGQKYNVLPGGKPELAHPKIEFKKTETGIIVSGRVRNEAELQRIAGRKFAQLGIQEKAIKAGSQSSEEYVPMLKTTITFSPEAWRAMAKMACNLFAHQRASMFIESGFDAIREFILRGVGDSWDFVAVNTRPVDLSGTALGQLDHLIAVVGDSYSGTVRGFVALYEHLQFVVNLGTASFDTPFMTTYRLNQLTQSDRFDAEQDQTIEMPEFCRYDEEHYAALLQAMGTGVNKIMLIAMERMCASALNEMIERSRRDGFGEPDGKPITQEQIDRFSRSLAERVVRLLIHEGLL